MFCETFWRFDYDAQRDDVTLTFTDLRPRGRAYFEMRRFSLGEEDAKRDSGIQFTRDRTEFTYREVASEDGEDDSDERWPDPGTKFFMTWKEIYDEYEDFFAGSDGADDDDGASDDDEDEGSDAPPS
jgi:hypothetical protein